jgi:hypothetical protein
MPAKSSKGAPLPSAAFDPGRSWLRLLGAFSLSLAGIIGLVAAFVSVFDPYGVGPLARSGHPVLMDMNQRYMYPQIVRSGRFDSLVVGTSTIRLLDPDRLDHLLGGHFANLAMNSATAWEQTQIARLFFRHTPHPRALMVGIDSLWCDEDATGPQKRLTFRGFPESFYDENPWNDWPELLNLKTIEIAWRMALYRTGLMPERYRNDGYEVFTPPEGTYDLARAQGHIWGGLAERRIVPLEPAEVPEPQEQASWRFPALGWLDELAAHVPADGKVIFVFPPNHVANQPRPGSRLEYRMEACKRAVAEIARRHRGLAIDFRFPSPITRDDANYWDNLHYRLPVAERIATAIADAWSHGGASPDGIDRLLATPAPTP